MRFVALECWCYDLRLSRPTVRKGSFPLLNQSSNCEATPHNGGVASLELVEAAAGKAKPYRIEKRCRRVKWVKLDNIASHQLERSGHCSHLLFHAVGTS